MKRAIGLIFLTAAFIVAFLSVRGSLPFIPIFGSSMEPTLKSGGLLFIDPMDSKDVRLGDIIVFNIPAAVREYYNYPPTVAHRVVKIITVPNFSFRPAGDNTGESPFTVRPQDIRGTVGKQIPYFGLPLLFFQSQQGVIFAVIALILLAIFLYGGEIRRGSGLLHRGVFAPVINEEKRANRMLSRQIEATEKKIGTTEQALEKFSLAVAEYAKHLARHTSAIQGLSDASQELKKGAAEQNRVLSAIMDNVVKSDSKRATVIIEESKQAPQKPVTKAKKTAGPTEKYHKALTNGTPGCARKHPPTSEEISSISH